MYSMGAVLTILGCVLVLLHGADSLLLSTDKQVVQPSGSLRLTVTFSGTESLGAAFSIIAEGFSVTSASPEPLTTHRVFSDAAQRLFLVAGINNQNGLSRATLPNAALLRMDLRAPASPGQYRISLSSALGANAQAQPVTIPNQSITVSVSKPEDVTNDGTVDYRDVLALVNMIISGGCAIDLTADGKCDILDVVHLIIVAMGG